MTLKRRKADKLPAAQTKDEAIAALGEYAAIAHQVEASDLRVEAAIAQLRAEADALNAPLLGRLKELFNRVKPWWAVSAEEITEGKRKSVELGGCVIGDRMTPPKLQYPTPEVVAVQLLHVAGWKGCLRVKVELDKPMLIAALKFLGTDGNEEGEEARKQLTSWGFKLTQKEEFFIDRLPPKGEPVEIVADPALQVAA